MVDRQSSVAPKKLYRSRQDRKLSGLCGGIAEYFDLDATLVRLAWIVITVLSGVIPGVLAYIIAAIVVPNGPLTEATS